MNREFEMELMDRIESLEQERDDLRNLLDFYKKRLDIYIVRLKREIELKQDAEDKLTKVSDLSERRLNALKCGMKRNSRQNECIYSLHSILRERACLDYQDCFEVDQMVKKAMEE